MSELIIGLAVLLAFIGFPLWVVWDTHDEKGTCKRVRDWWRRINGDDEEGR